MKSRRSRFLWDNLKMQKKLTSTKCIENGTASEYEFSNAHMTLNDCYCLRKSSICHALYPQSATLALVLESEKLPHVRYKLKRSTINMVSSELSLVWLLIIEITPGKSEIFRQTCSFHLCSLCSFSFWHSTKHILICSTVHQISRQVCTWSIKML